MCTRKKFLKRLVSILIALFSFSPELVAQQIYRVPVPAGQSSISVSALSKDGSVVIGQSGGKCVRWYVGSSSVEILPGDTEYPNSGCYGVSASGSSLAGSVSNTTFSERRFASWSGSSLHRWTNPELQFSQASANSISPGGGVLGGTVYANTNYYPIRVTTAGIEYLPRRFIADPPIAMSADGQVLVGGNSYAVRWVNNGLGWTDQNLGTTRSGSPAGASDVNWTGDVVVGYDGSSVNSLRAFRWINGTGIQALGLPSGTTSAYVTSVSDDGNFIGGGAKFSNLGGAWRAMVWRQGIGWTNLTTLLTSQGVDLTGWILNEVTDVSGDGTLVLVSGSYNSGDAAFVTQIGATPVTGQAIQFGDPNVFSSPSNSAPATNTGFPTARDPESVLTWSDQTMLNAPSVIGAAADGVTRLVVRWPISGPGTATFQLTDENGDAISVGRLGVPGAAPAYTYLPSQAARQVNGSWYVFASYAVPSEFGRYPSDDNLSSRTIRVKAQFTPANGSPKIVSSSSFSLIRPPVLFLHGFASSAADSWGLNLQHDSRFITYAHDYSATSQNAFNQNIREPRRGVERLIRTAHHYGYAATQVTVIGHSMGGLLARLHAGNREGAYYRPSNLGQGDFYKLITLYSPHYGSPVACLLENNEAWFTYLLGTSPICAHCGAVSDLRVNSAQIAGLPAVNVPTHVIAGVGGTDAINQALANALNFRSALRFAQNIEALLSTYTDPNTLWGDRHDLVVGEQSAYGPLAAPFRSTIGFAINPENPHNPVGIHIGAGKQNIVGQQYLLPLLLSSRSSGLFSAIPANGSITAPPVCGSNPPPPPPLAPLGSMSVSQPLGGSVMSGSTARITVAHNSAFTPAAIFVVGEDIMMKVPPAATVVDVPVPGDSIGSKELRVIARDASGTVAVSNTVTFNVGSTQALTGLEAAPEFLPLGCMGESISLTVMGHFGPNIDRDLSTAATGTTYLSADTNVARVDANGRVSAVRAGSTTITIRNGAFHTSVDVTVSPNWCTPTKISPTTQVLRDAIAVLHVCRDDELC